TLKKRKWLKKIRKISFQRVSIPNFPVYFGDFLLRKFSSSVLQQVGPQSLKESFLRFQGIFYARSSLLNICRLSLLQPWPKEFPVSVGFRPKKLKTAKS